MTDANSDDVLLRDSPASPGEAKRVLEAVLLSTREPLSMLELRKVFDDRIDAAVLRVLLDEIGITVQDEIDINTDFLIAGAARPVENDEGEQVMEQVTKLVEDRLHLAVGEQSGLIIRGRRHVAADQAEVRLAVRLRPARRAGAQVVHPGSAALRVARVPVGIE